MKFIVDGKTLAVLLACSVAVGCMNNSSAALEPLVVSDNQSCHSISLKKNQPLIIKLKSNPTTGYQWRIAKLPAFLSIVVADDYQQDNKPKEMVGVGGESTWRFDAQKSGAGYLVLSYERPWEKGQPAEVLKCMVRVD